MVWTCHVQSVRARVEESQKPTLPLLSSLVLDAERLAAVSRV
jgi:hypothetical protein